MAHMHTRIPSWLHMPGLGLPVVASWGDNAFTAAAVQAADMERVSEGGLERRSETKRAWSSGAEVPLESAVGKLPAQAHMRMSAAPC